MAKRDLGLKLALVLLVLLFSSINSMGHSKKKSPILYELPPKVDSMLAGYIKLNDGNNKQFTWYAVLSKDSDLYKVIIVREATFSNNNDMNIVRASNRFIKLKSNVKLPLLLADYDQKFINPKYSINTSGDLERSEIVPVYHNFYIVFRMDGVIVRHANH